MNKLRNINASMTHETPAEQIEEIEELGEFPIKTAGSLLAVILVALSVWGITVKREHWREDEIDRIQAERVRELIQSGKGAKSMYESKIIGPK